VFVELFPPWAPAPQPTADALRTPPLIGPNSPLKGFAIPITDIEVEMFMDNLGDDDELELDNSELHQLFPPVVEAMFFGLDFEGADILVEEILVPVPGDWGVPISTEEEPTEEDATGPRFWRATGVVLAHNRDEYDVDLSGARKLVKALQRQLGVKASPGWYEVVEKEGPELTEKQIRKLCKKSGSSELREMATLNWL
jgi:hypothetical protein